MSSSNIPSVSLSDEENELLFTLIGNRKQSKSSAVVQMFHAHPDKTQWTKFRTGVVCFVKDNVKKSYFIRLYDLTAKSMVYEQEVYNQFTYKKERSYFHSFPGDKYTVGLNFTEEKEAAKFKEAVDSKLFEREKRATIKRSKEDSNATPIGRPPVNTVDSGMDPFAGSSKKAKPKKPRGKICKSDISAPSDFRHLSHVGFDPATGAFDSSNIAPDWKKLLDTVGVTTEQLKDKSTATFIYDFVEKHGGIQEANRQLEEASRHGSNPPTPPNRRQGGGKGHGGRNLPPPPPRESTSRGAPPPPPPGRMGPPPPAPPSSKGGPAPPPPPPPPPVGGPAPPPPPPVGGGGVPSRSVGPPPPPTRESKPTSSLPVVSDGRGDLLASIRKGKNLKKVTAEEAARGASPPEDGDLDGMAGALARALAQRNNVIQQSDSEEEEEEWGAEDDDDWGSD